MLLYCYAKQSLGAVSRKTLKLWLLIDLLRILKHMKSIDKARAQQKEKESCLKELASILSSSGYSVRREKLKQGHGWRAVSGSCRVLGDKMVFLDRRLPADEQIDFLIDRITSFGIQVPAEKASVFPPSIAQRVGLEAVGAVAS